MLLSEAILLGSVGTKQGFGPYLIDFKRGTACALGAALVASGWKQGNTEIDGYSFLCYQWPFLKNESPLCPMCKRSDETIIRRIYHLNDIHRWTRPQISEWIKTIEASLLPVPREVTNENRTTSASPAYPGERQVAPSL